MSKKKCDKCKSDMEYYPSVSVWICKDLKCSNEASEEAIDNFVRSLPEKYYSK